MKNNYKIAYIIPRFHPFKGGAERNFEALATRMAKAGNNVTVLTTKVPFKNEKLPNLENYNGVLIKRHWVLTHSLYLAFWPGLLFSLIKNKYDLIHVSGFGFIWTELCLLLSRVLKPRTKIINTPHGPFLSTSGDSGFRKLIKQIYDRWLSLINPWLYSNVIGVVPKQKDWITQIYGISEEKFEVIPNGIDTDYVENTLVTHDNSDPVVITYLNRMEWYKGIQDVIKALNHIQEKGITNFRFYIMGRKGNYTEDLQDLVKKLDLDDAITFIFTPTDAKRDEILKNESQINILPSKWEATGIALLEAMAKGNAIITTYQNQAVDVLISEKSGYAYNFGDVETLSKILESLITNNVERKKMREHNLNFVKDFTWDEIFQTYESMIQRIID